ncbi:hypothetical protein IGB42_00335 [Andreprevotia sp. IGB-42]|uniref:putative signal transducing protein n=1 Tax=Andreprevotia sp. IGB-42 TaxID=2497473 RepID=UPI00135CC4CD|nr:DUF2007 domain-containing protein [Andreprevotia sp. IGB-42]KAF0815254.1 hypothetical protein IGB42_00335 [Andreprevotia sp. IGB-42]
MAPATTDTTPLDCPPPDPVTLVTLRHFDTLPDAAIIRGLLESNGIPVRLSDAYIVQANPLLSTAVGGLRLEVPADRLAEAEALLASMAAGELIDTETADTDTAPVAPMDPMPPLWHPDWAWALGWITSGPWLPMLLHYQNWKKLDQSREARKALYWLLSSAALALSATGYALGVARDLNVLIALGMLVFGPMLIIWYLLQGRRQSQLLLRWPYPRRPMWLAAWLGIIAAISFWLGAYFVLQHGIPLEQRVADLAQQANAQRAVRADGITSKVEARAEGEKLILVVEVQNAQVTEESLAAVIHINTWKTCHDPKMHDLFLQGMTLETRIVDPDKTLLGEYQITKANCNFAS